MTAWTAAGECGAREVEGAAGRRTLFVEHKKLSVRYGELFYAQRGKNFYFATSHMVTGTGTSCWVSGEMGSVHMRL